mmetsp:Transcript_1609/g.5611  ORF Transcript_1609/g.5611 Transcript_1609/m.5611 type:complete len:309 (+) Transcript_1609:98-1024(+)
MSSLEIKFSRAGRVYKAGDTVKGTISLKHSGGAANPLAHQGIEFEAIGEITLRAPSGAADGSRSLSLFAIRKVLAPPGKCINAVTNWDFEFELEPSTEAKTRGYNVHDTYHGCQVLVQYAVRVLVQRGMWAPSIKETEEFLLDSSSRFDFDKLQGSQTLSVTPVSFAVPNTALLGDEQGTIDIQGRVDNVNLRVFDRIGGELCLKAKHPSVRVRSIATVLQAVETCTFGAESQPATITSDVQKLQVAAGDILVGSSVPIHMVLPRLLCCPSVKTEDFSVGFVLGIVLEYVKGGEVQQLSTQIPLTLVA